MHPLKTNTLTKVAKKSILAPSLRTLRLTKIRGTFDPNLFWFLCKKKSNQSSYYGFSADFFLYPLPSHFLNPNGEMVSLTSSKAPPLMRGSE